MPAGTRERSGPFLLYLKNSCLITLSSYVAQVVFVFLTSSLFLLLLSPWLVVSVSESRTKDYVSHNNTFATYSKTVVPREVCHST